MIAGCREWNADLCIGLTEFEKAFDSVEHGPMWAALREQGIEEHYIQMLKSLYRNQVAHVSIKSDSREFALTRGVKQGDPISGLLFIAILESCMKRLKEKWAALNNRRTKSQFGIAMAEGDSLTILRFADDIMLLATTRADIRKKWCSISITKPQSLASACT